MHFGDASPCKNQPPPTVSSNHRYRRLVLLAQPCGRRQRRQPFDRNHHVGRLTMPRRRRRSAQQVFGTCHPRPHRLHVTELFLAREIALAAKDKSVRFQKSSPLAFPSGMGATAAFWRCSLRDWDGDRHRPAQSLNIGLGS